MPPLDARPEALTGFKIAVPASDLMLTDPPIPNDQDITDEKTPPQLPVFCPVMEVLAEMHDGEMFFPIPNATANNKIAAAEKATAAYYDYCRGCNRQEDENPHSDAITQVQVTRRGTRTIYQGAIEIFHPAKSEADLPVLPNLRDDKFAAAPDVNPALIKYHPKDIFMEPEEVLGIPRKKRTLKSIVIGFYQTLTHHP